VFIESYIDYIYLTNMDWVTERMDVLYRLKRDIPEGRLHNSYWVEDLEWDVPTLQERIQKHFKRIAMNYKNHD